MSEPKSKNIRWERSAVNREARARQRGHRGATLWFTGLSGSGKSTLAHTVEQRLTERGHVAYALDGDNVRHGLNSDLGFSPEDRSENIRRVGEVAKLFTDAGVLACCAFISPYRADRQRVRDLLGEDFVEIHVCASVETCKQRDPKGLYRKAAAGEVQQMTGVGAPYEAPDNAELVLDTERVSLEQNVDRVLGFLTQRGYIGAPPSEAATGEP